LKQLKKIKKKDGRNHWRFYETKEKIEEYEKNEILGGKKDVSNGDGCCHVGCIIH